MILASAKKGIGIEEIFEAVIRDVPPPPSSKRNGKQCVVLQDSWFDAYRGLQSFTSRILLFVIAFVFVRTALRLKPIVEL